MGLDTVELLIKTEDFFGIKISDANAEKIYTVGDFHATVLALLQASGRNADHDVIWAELHKIVVDQLGVRPEEVIPTARFVDDLGVE